MTSPRRVSFAADQVFVVESYKALPLPIKCSIWFTRRQLTAIRHETYRLASYYRVAPASLAALCCDDDNHEQNNTRVHHNVPRLPASTAVGDRTSELNRSSRGTEQGPAPLPLLPARPPARQEPQVQYPNGRQLMARPNSNHPTPPNHAATQHSHPQQSNQNQHHHHHPHNQSAASQICLRGLENRSELGSQERNTNRTLGLAAVIGEQARQRIHHPGRPIDQTAIARLYQVCCSESRDIAQALANQDRADVLRDMIAEQEAYRRYCQFQLEHSQRSHLEHSQRSHLEHSQRSQQQQQQQHVREPPTAVDVIDQDSEHDKGKDIEDRSGSPSSTIVGPQDPFFGKQYSEPEPHHEDNSATGEESAAFDSQEETVDDDDFNEFGEAQETDDGSDDDESTSTIDLVDEYMRLFPQMVAKRGKRDDDDDDDKDDESTGEETVATMETTETVATNESEDTTESNETASTSTEATAPILSAAMIEAPSNKASSRPTRKLSGPPPFEAPGREQDELDEVTHGHDAESWPRYDMTKVLLTKRLRARNRLARLKSRRAAIAGAV